ncbi:MAG: DUF2061 domain-containing protein [Pelistega sp.]|nr:DUF2061 domain-containing protein [Pelistega sp.]
MMIIEKTSQALLHMSVAFAISYGFTGSLAFGGLMAVVEPICNVLLLPLHDKAWRRIKYKQRMRQRNLSNKRSSSNQTQHTKNHAIGYAA